MFCHHLRVVRRKSEISFPIHVSVLKTVAEFSYARLDSQDSPCFGSAGLKI
jgi:hypothetical protein